LTNPDVRGIALEEGDETEGWRDAQQFWGGK
jgi:hypothetical protein